MLFKGFGNENGSSIVVQFQAEISKLQEMVNQTLPRVEEIEKQVFITNYIVISLLLDN